MACGLLPLGLFWILLEGEGAEVTLVMFSCHCWGVVPSFLSLQLTLVLVYESVEVGCLPFHLLQTGFELILER